MHMARIGGSPSRGPEGTRLRPYAAPEYGSSRRATSHRGASIAGIVSLVKIDAFARLTRRGVFFLRQYWPNDSDFFAVDSSHPRQPTARKLE